MIKYLCPYCRTQLNVDKNVILVGHSETGCRALILLSQDLGDYNVKMAPECPIKKGDKVHFHCPVCSKSLDYARKEDFAWLIKTDEEGKEFTIVFSAIFGDHATYKISEERTLTYGEKALKFMNPEWYIQEDMEG